MSLITRPSAADQIALSSPSPDIRDIRPLDDRSLSDVQRLLDADPLVNAVVSARLDECGTLDAQRLGGALYGVDGELTAACFHGGNLLPIGGDPATWEALGEFVGLRRRACSSIVATTDTVAVLWPVLARRWGPARRMQPAQPLLVTGQTPDVEADPDVRAARISEFDAYLPAAAAMFAEELGVTDRDVARRPGYRARLADLLNAGRAFMRLDARGQVLFKAELAAVSRHTCQVQGVWVRPDMRGRGVGTAAMASVVAAALTLAPTVSLYVNDYNVPARRLYDRLKMRQVATLSTVLF